MTSLPRITPIVGLEENAQLNVLDELVQQGRDAHRLKASLSHTVCSLTSYASSHSVLPPPSAVLPSECAQLRDHKPTCIRRPTSTHGASSLRDRITKQNAGRPNGSIIIYVDRSTRACKTATAAHCYCKPALNKTSRFGLPETPSS